MAAVRGTVRPIGQKSDIDAVRARQRRGTDNIVSGTSSNSHLLGD